MAGGACAAHREQPRFGLGRGHAGQGANLRVGQLPASDGLGQQGQRPEGARNADALPGRAQIEADPPGKPVGAGAEAGVPATSRVEVPDQGEQARGGGVEMGGQLGDLVTEAVSSWTRCGETSSVGDSVGMAWPPSTGATLHLDFRGAWEHPARAIRGQRVIFGQPPPERATMGPRAHPGWHSASAARA
jgi:hypothetical protein